MLKTVPALVVVSAPVATTVSAKIASANHAEKAAVPVARLAVPSVPRAASAKGSLHQSAAAASEFRLAAQAMICIFETACQNVTLLFISICACAFSSI
ncbi:UNVERIFIED_CONTAM: hypothetical protein K2H54_030185 [Gekko kuhli]